MWSCLGGITKLHMLVARIHTALYCFSLTLQLWPDEEASMTSQQRRKKYHLICGWICPAIFVAVRSGQLLHYSPTRGSPGETGVAFMDNINGFCGVSQWKALTRNWRKEGWSFSLGFLSSGNDECIPTCWKREGLYRIRICFFRFIQFPCGKRETTIFCKNPDIALYCVCWG